MKKEKKSAALSADQMPAADMSADYISADYVPLTNEAIQQMAQALPKQPLTDGSLKNKLTPAFIIDGDPLLPPTGQSKRLCLVMIIKNEEDCIERCLTMVAPYISYWIICDTGSTDKTQSIVQDFMTARKIPGKLYTRPWYGYDFNRNESLSLSYGIADYRLLMDADDQLQTDENKNPFSVLDKGLDCYDASILSGSLEWRRAVVINSHQPWAFKGIIHEFLVNPEKSTPSTREYLAGLVVIAGLSANRKYKDPKTKYLKDVDLLKIGLTLEPENARYQFYLGQSLMYAGEIEKAKAAFSKRAEMGGWAEEVYYALFNIGSMNLKNKAPEEVIINTLSKAYEYRPSRLEALFTLMHYLVTNKRHRLAYIYAVSGLGGVKSPSKDTLFVDQTLWRWRFAELFSVICSQLGMVDQAVLILSDVLKSPFKESIPPEDITRIEKNLLLFSENSKQFKV